LSKIEHLKPAFIDLEPFWNFDSYRKTLISFRQSCIMRAALLGRPRWITELNRT